MLAHESRAQRGQYSRRRRTLEDLPSIPLAIEREEIQREQEFRAREDAEILRVAARSSHRRSTLRSWCSFSASRVIVQSMKVVAGNVLPFATLAITLYIVCNVYENVWSRSALASEHLLWDIVIGRALPQLVLPWLLVTFLMWGTVQQMAGRSPGLFDSLTNGLERAIAAFSTTAIMGLIAGGVAYAAISGIFSIWRAAGPEVALIAGVIMALIAIPIYCGLWMTAAVAVFENPGVRSSFQRSRYLSERYRGQIFLLVSLQIMVGVLLGGGLEYALGFIQEGQWVGRVPAQVYQLGPIVLGALSAVWIAVAYCELRANEQNMEFAELADDFADELAKRPA